MSESEDEPDRFEDASMSLLSRLRAIDIPERLELTRRLRDRLADSAEAHPDPNPLSLIAQIPNMQGAFVSTVMGLEMQIHDLQRQINELR
jgi:hypothetical protein